MEKLRMFFINTINKKGTPRVPEMLNSREF